MNIEHDRFTFVDFGAGKGRVLMMACEYPFKQVIGVELSRKLHATASRNYNIGFAKWVEPNNADLLQRDADDMAKQEKGMPTVPFTLALELKTNPFMDSRFSLIRSGYTIKRSRTSVHLRRRWSVKMKLSGRIMRSAEEWEMSRSFHRGMFSSAT